jgi:hypothetical protein
MVRHLDDFFIGAETTISQKTCLLSIVLSANYHHVHIPEVEYIDYIYCHFCNIGVKFGKNEFRILIVAL